MTTAEKRQQIKYIQRDVNSPKRELMHLQSRLEKIGAIREAGSLGTIIGKLEHWQNKYGR